MPTRSSHTIPITCCLDGQVPEVAGYAGEHCVDLVVIRNVDGVTTARVPARGRVDILAPEMVVWAYQCPPQQALRALFDLVRPAHPDALTARYSAPASLNIPRAQQHSIPTWLGGVWWVARSGPVSASCSLHTTLP